MTSEVPEIKLAKLRVTALIEKMHCWSYICAGQPLLFINEKELRYNKI